MAALLTAIYAQKQSERWTVAELIRLAASEPGGSLAGAVDEIALGSGGTNPRILGRWIERHTGRILAGLKFERGSRLAKRQTWWLRKL